MVGFWTLFWGCAVLIAVLVAWLAKKYRYRCTSVLLALSWVLWNSGFALLGSDATVALFPVFDSAAAVVVILLALKHNKLWLWFMFMVYVAMLSSYVAYQSNVLVGLGDGVIFLAVMNALFGLQLLAVIIPGVREIVSSRCSSASPSRHINGAGNSG